MTTTITVIRLSETSSTPDVKRVPANTKGSERMPVWTRSGARVPKMGEETGTFRDGSTLYAMSIRK